MTGIFLSNQSFKTQSLLNSYGLDGGKLVSGSCENPDTIGAYTPYMLADNDSAVNTSILKQLSGHGVSRDLTNFSLSFGGDNLMALSEMTKNIQESGLGVVGASTSVYGGRMGAFGKAIKEYQDALMLYRDAVKSNAASKTIAKKSAQSAFNKLQSQFKNELRTVAGRVKSSRGSALTSSKRALNIARDSRSVASLNVTNQTQAHNLVKFAKHAKLLGNGLAVIDFGSRVGGIHNTYKEGGNWEREMFVESASFASSAMMGTVIVNAGLGLLLVATPVGWVGLIVGGIAVAGIAAASIKTNSLVKKNSGGIYDNIMNWISF